MKLQSKISLTFNTFIFLIAFSAVSVNGEVRSCQSATECADFQMGEFDIIAICFEGICQCSTYGIDIDCYVKNDTMNTQIYGPCPCAMPHAECIENHCVCAPTFTPSKDMRRCIIAVVNYNQLCEHDDQCQALDTFAICNVTGLGFWPECTCLYGFMRAEDSGRCRQIIPDSDCDEDEHCSRHFMSKCDWEWGRCICSAGWVHDRSGRNCYRGSGYGWRCHVHEQCREALGVTGICENEICTCKKPFMKTLVKKIDNTTTSLCRLPPRLGYACIDDRDCFRPDKEKQTLSCFHGTCKCKYGYVSKTNSTCNRGDTFSIHLHVLYFVIAIPFLKYFSSFI